MLGNIKFLIIALVAAVTAGTLGFQQYSIKKLKTENTVLVANSAVLSNALEESQKSIETLVEEYKKVKVAYDAAVEEFSKIDKNKASAVDVIASTDLNDVETATEAANKLYRDSIRCLEISSGAELTEREKNAKDANSFNSSCPWLFDISRVQPAN